MKTITELLKGDVYEEDFLIAFYNMVEKFAEEYDDMASMKAIQQAQALLKTLKE